MLITEYCKHQTPYLTIIHLWDNYGGYLLSRKHDPLKCGRGEGGIDNDEISISSPSRMKSSRARNPRKKKEDPSPIDIVAVMKSLTNVCNDNKSAKNNGKSVGKSIDK